VYADRGRRRGRERMYVRRRAASTACRYTGPRQTISQAAEWACHICWPWRAGPSGSRASGLPWTRRLLCEAGWTQRDSRCDPSDREVNTNALACLTREADLSTDETDLLHLVGHNYSSHSLRLVMWYLPDFTKQDVIATNPYQMENIQELQIHRV